MSCSQHGCKQKIFKTKKEGGKKSQFLCNLPHAHFISPYTSRGRSQRKFPISGQSDWSNQYFSSLAEDGLLGYLSCAPQEVPLLVFKKNTLEKKPQIKSQISSLLRMSWPRVEEEKRKKLWSKSRGSTATGEKLIKIWRLFRKRKASDRHNYVDTPSSLKYFWLTKSSHWLFVMVNAPPPRWSWQFSPPSL